MIQVYLFSLLQVWHNYYILATCDTTNFLNEIKFYLPLKESFFENKISYFTSILKAMITFHIS